MSTKREDLQVALSYVDFSAVKDEDLDLIEFLIQLA